MMPPIIDEAIRDNQQLWSSVSLATGMIEPLQESSSEPVKVEWKKHHDEQGHAVVELTLSDFAGAVSERFEPRELRDVKTFGHYVARLWGDLLQNRSHKQLDKLRQLVADLEED